MFHTELNKSLPKNKDQNVHAFISSVYPLICFIASGNFYLRNGFMSSYI